MKKVTSFILFCILFCISVLLFLKYDSNRFAYGWHCSFCNQRLPYNIEHKYYFDHPQQFYLINSDGFELLGNGFKFYGSSFKIKDFLGYGYNDTSIIAKVTDSLNNIKYLVSYETKYKSKKGNPEISFRDIDDSYFEQEKENYQWVVLDEKRAQNITFKRFLSFVGALLSLFFIVRKLFKSRKNKATN